MEWRQFYALEEEKLSKNKSLRRRQSLKSKIFIPFQERS